MTLAALGLADVLGFLIGWVVLAILFWILWGAIAASLRRRRRRP